MRALGYKLYLTLIMLLVLATQAKAQDIWYSPDGYVASVQVYYREDGRFMASDNKVQLETLKSLVEVNKKLLASGDCHIWVDSYIQNEDLAPYDCRKEARVLSNLIKSYMIVNLGLSESDFITKNFCGTYDKKSGATLVTIGLRYPFEYFIPRQLLDLSGVDLDGKPLDITKYEEYLPSGGGLDTVLLHRIDTTKIISPKFRKANELFYGSPNSDMSGLNADMPLPGDIDFGMLRRQNSSMLSANVAAPPSVPAAQPNGAAGWQSSAMEPIANAIDKPKEQPKEQPKLEKSKGKVKDIRVEDKATPIVEAKSMPSTAPVLMPSPSVATAITPATMPPWAYAPPMAGGNISSAPMSGTSPGTAPAVGATTPVPSFAPPSFGPKAASGPAIGAATFTGSAKGKKGGNNKGATVSRFKGAGKNSMPSVEVAQDGSIRLNAAAIGQALNRQATEDVQKEAKSREMAIKRAEKTIAVQVKDDKQRAIRESKGRFALVGFGVNALAALTTTPSAQLDFYIHDRFSLSMEGAYNKWNFLGENYRTSLWTVLPEFRVWLGKKKQFSGWYVGLYGGVGEYNFRFNSTKGTQSSFYNVGVSVGYVLQLGNQSNFYVDFGLAGGYFGEKGQNYLYFNGMNFLENTFVNNGFAPAKAKVTFIYRFFNKTKSGLF